MSSSASDMDEVIEQEVIELRLYSYESAALDLWIAMRHEDGFSREEAIRQILTKVIIRQ